MTAQSSTESTQDAHQDSRAQRTCPWPQDGRSLYSSTDSLDSNKAMNLALETAAAQRHTDGQGSPVRPSDKTILTSVAEELLKSRCSSIGVQVASRAAPGAPITHSVDQGCGCGPETWDSEGTYAGAMPHVLHLRNPQGHFQGPLLLGSMKRPPMSQRALTRS